LYSLLKRVKKCQAKFLARCLEHFLNDCDDLQQLEEEANSHGLNKYLFDTFSCALCWHLVWECRYLSTVKVSHKKLLFLCYKLKLADLFLKVD